MKALEKDRARRYETANGFAADVQRYLTASGACPPAERGLPAEEVRPPQSRAGDGGEPGAGGLVAGVVGTSVGLVRAPRGRRSGRRRTARPSGPRGSGGRSWTRWRSWRTSGRRWAAIARAISDFLQEDLLAQAGDRVPRGRQPTTRPDSKPEEVRQVLDLASAKIGGAISRSSPLVEAAIRLTHRAKATRNSSLIGRHNLHRWNADELLPAAHASGVIDLRLLDTGQRTRPAVRNSCRIPQGGKNTS